MVNQSKVKDPRFWEKWRDSGAVGSLSKCDEDCFYIDMFGGVEGCGALDHGYGFYHEPIEPGQNCLYPDRKEFGTDLGVVSAAGLDAALLGQVVTGGKHDNTKLVLTLIQ